jgi:YgiT-type zinc finger domain-containing protein
MKCVICKKAETKAGLTTVTLERDGLTLVIKRVPARVCPNCGEAYVEENVTAQLLHTAEETAKAHALVDIREYTPA